MEGSEGRRLETEKLAKLFEKLEQDWHTFKQHSEDWRNASRRFDYCDCPRDIMYELQRDTSSSEEEEKKNRKNAHDELEDAEERSSIVWYNSNIEDNTETKYCSAGGCTSSSSSYCPLGDCDCDKEDVEAIIAMRLADIVDKLENRKSRRSRFADIWRWFLFAFFVVAMFVGFVKNYGAVDVSQALLPT